MTPTPDTPEPAPNGSAAIRVNHRWRLIGGSALTALCLLGAAAPTAFAAPSTTSVGSSASATGQLVPNDILDAVQGGKDVYDYAQNCRANMKAHLPCTTSEEGRHFVELTDHINALSDQVTAQTQQINTNGTALYEAVTQADANNAWRNLGGQNAQMQIVAAKEMDYERCVGALNQTTLNAMPGGSGAVASCTLTNGNGIGHPELDPATGQPKQYPMRSMDDITAPDGPQSRLLDATLTAYVPNQPDRSNPAAVYDAFRDQGLKAQSALAGNGPSDGLLPEVFTTTINSDYVQDSNHQKTPDGTPPAYLSGSAVDTINQANTAMTGLEAQYFNGMITALRIVEQQNPSAPAPAAGQAQDADWADTLAQQITQGPGSLTQQSLSSQRNSWSIPVCSADHSTLSPTNAAGPNTGFVITYPDANAKQTLVAYQATLTAKGNTVDGTSNPAPADPYIPTKAELDSTADRLQAMGQPTATLRSNHPDAVPATMWADMGKTETLLLADTNDDPGDLTAGGHDTTVTTARPSDAAPGAWSEAGSTPGYTFKWSDKSDDECIAPVQMWDSGYKGSYEPALQDATTSLLTPGSRLPSLTKHIYTVISDPWPITEWSGYQMDWNHEVIHTRNPADPQQTESLDLSGFDAYNGYNAGHGAVPVFDMVYTKKAVGYYGHQPVYTGAGPGFLYRCGGNDHVADSGGRLAPVATDTWEFQQVKVNPSPTDASGTHPGGWANIMPSVK